MKIKKNIRYLERQLSQIVGSSSDRKIIRSRFEAVKSSLLSNVDLFCVDGDHTLKEIFLDLCSAYKFSKNSSIILNDVCGNIWQYGINYQITLVWSFAKYFSQFYGYSIFLLPCNQALLVPGKRFKVSNLSNIDYNESVENWVPSQSIISKIRKASNFVGRFLRGSGQ